MVGDGEAETGPLATAWHSNKFINPIRDGAVLPILNLNGYKIANPTILARISHDRLKALFHGYGYTPYFVEGDDPDTMHQAMAATLEKPSRRSARSSGRRGRAARPSSELADDRAALTQGLDRAEGDQRPQGRRFLALASGAFSDVRENPAHLKLLEDWMRSYKPEDCSMPTAGWCPNCAHSPRPARGA